MSDPVDHLFQLPLGEFTAARNALAKSDPAHGEAIKRLEKPSASAWAVNQVYWRNRKAYDKLVKASDRLRAANAQILSGKKVDLEPIELAHRAAIRDAAALAHDALVASGDAASPATVQAVRDTLGALPVAGPPGRLTKPLGIVGFDSLSGLLKSAGLAKGAPADVVPFEAPKTKSAAAAAEREAAKEADRLRAEAAARAAERRGLDAKRRKLEDRVKHTRVRIAALNRDLDAANAEIDAVNQELQHVLDALERLPH